MLCNTTDGDKGECHGRRQFPDGDGIIHWPVAGVLQTNARSGRGCRRGKAGILNPADNTYDGRTEMQDGRATWVARLVIATSAAGPAMYIIFVECPHELRWRVAGGPDPKEVNRATEGGCPESPAFGDPGYRKPQPDNSRISDVTVLAPANRKLLGQQH